MTQDFTFKVPANDPWFKTNVQIKRGNVLALSANGSWWDLSVKCNADGYNAPLFYRLGILPRVPDNLFYFKLVGVICDAGESGTDFQVGDRRFQVLKIGRNSGFTAERDGELFLFANDARFMYWNNFGHLNVTLIVEQAY